MYALIYILKSETGFCTLIPTLIVKILISFYTEKLRQVLKSIYFLRTFGLETKFNILDLSL